MNDDRTAEGIGPRSTDATALSLDLVLELLADRRRRRVLSLLLDHGRPLTVPDLAKEIAVSEQESAITDVPGGDVRRLHLALQHAHVPKLAAAGLVTYDRDRRLVEPTDRLDRLAANYSALLDLVLDAE